jgi:tetratricopeptide (TPR) repeat protein
VVPRGAGEPVPVWTRSSVRSHHATTIVQTYRLRPAISRSAHSKVSDMMSRAAHLCLVGSALTCAASISTPSFGQHANAAGLLYSHGVHAYFAGHDEEAEQYLTRAIQSDPNDPRPYYFRAMSRLRRGQDADARQDMQQGAAVEVRAPGRWGVGSALQRVQGTDRLLLEDFRRSARLGEAARQDERNRARYEQIIRRESEVLRRAVEVPLEKLVQPAAPQELIDGQAEPRPRAKSPDAATPQREEPARPARALGDPFADDPLQAMGKAADSPPDKPRPAAEPNAGDDKLSAEPDNEATSGQSPEKHDASSETDEEDLFGDF